MSTEPDIKGSITGKRIGAVRTLLDVLLILAMGLVAEAAHFTWRDGRAVVNGDCIQYVDAAEALLSEDTTPNFALRKPGYPLILAGVARATGNMTWAPIAVNHLLFQALLPLAAYGLGRNLRSRRVGWVAAVLTIAQLQAFIGGDRLMSESAFMCFTSFGLLALAAGLRHRCSLRLIAMAGLLLAASWLTRSVAAVVIAASLLCALWVMRKEPRRALAACLCLALPVATAALIECSLNRKYSGHFRLSTGSFGMMLLNRTRQVQGLPLPDTDAGRRCLELLPQHADDGTYWALEEWVARYTAVHDNGMDDWAFDALMTRAAVEMIAAHKTEFLKCSLDVFTRQLLRRGDGSSYAHVPPEMRLPTTLHAAAVDDPKATERWYAYWALPHRSLEESLALASRVESGASVRAPFTQNSTWATLRYISRCAPVVDVMGVLRSAGRIWPGFALILCAALGLNRRTCALLAIVYILEAALLSICMPTEFAHERFQSVWLVTDTTLAAALLTVGVTWAMDRTRSERLARESQAAADAAETEHVRRRLDTDRARSTQEEVDASG